MNAMFGSTSGDLASLARIVGSLLSVEFRPHESDFLGGNYYRAEVENGEIVLRNNFDVLDHEVYEGRWPEMNALIYFDGEEQARDQWTKRLQRVEEVGFRRLT